jgi:hypothetical protein
MVDESFRSLYLDRGKSVILDPMNFVINMNNYKFPGSTPNKYFIKAY